MDKQILGAAALSDAFSILALLTQYPTADVAEGLASGALGDDMAAIAADLGLDGEAVRAACAPLCGTDAGELLSRMRVAYTALFNHPERPLVPLYEGQYRYDREEAPHLAGGDDTREASSARSGEGEAGPVSRRKRGAVDARPRLFVNPASLDALREYRAARVAPEDERQLPADAMPVEMEFCSLLCLRLSRALLEEDGEGAAAARGALDEFFRIHLAKWMSGFYGDCARMAPCEAYRAMGVFGAAVAERLKAGRSLAACA